MRVPYLWKKGWFIVNMSVILKSIWIWTKRLLCQTTLCQSTLCLMPNDYTPNDLLPTMEKCKIPEVFLYTFLIRIPNIMHYLNTRLSIAILQEYHSNLFTGWSIVLWFKSFAALIGFENLNSYFWYHHCSQFQTKRYLVKKKLYMGHILYEIRMKKQTFYCSLFSIKWTHHRLQCHLWSKK